MPREYDNTGKVVDAVERATKVALMAAIIDMHNQATLLASGSVVTGNLMGSLSWTVGGAHSGVRAPAGATDGVRRTTKTDTAYLGTNVHYGPHVEYGTKPHTIRAKNAMVLTDGKTFFGKQVQHPGTQPKSFLRAAYDARKKYTKEIMAHHYKKAIEGVTR